MGKEKHEVYTITNIVDEARDVKTFEFDKPLKARPGQFVMARLPGVSENPFSVRGSNPLRLTVKLRGDFTQALFEKKPGNKVFIRGPYGTSFEDFCHHLHGEDYENYDVNYYIAGGYGSVPLAFLAEQRKGLMWVKSKVLIGAKTKEEVLFEDVFRKLSDDVRIATDDGSYGVKGPVTDLFDEIPENSYVFACGPDKMLLAVAEKAKTHTDPEHIILSVERYMKCGQGLCRCCEITGSDGTGLSVCQDGPVFTYAQLIGGDLGKYHREKSGLKTQI